MKQYIVQVITDRSAKTYQFPMESENLHNMDDALVYMTQEMDISEQIHRIDGGNIISLQIILVHQE